MAGRRKTARKSARRVASATAPHVEPLFSGVWQTLAPTPRMARRRRPRVGPAIDLKSAAVLGLLLAVSGCAPDVAIAGLLRLVSGG